MGCHYYTHSPYNSDPDSSSLASTALSSLYTANSVLATVAADQIIGEVPSLDCFNNIISDLDAASSSLDTISSYV